MSNCRMHINAVNPAPHSDSGRIKGLMLIIKLGSILISRNIPYLPNLRRTLARIIDPAVGAST